MTKSGSGIRPPNTETLRGSEGLDLDGEVGMSDVMPLIPKLIRSVPFEP